MITPNIGIVLLGLCILGTQFWWIRYLMRNEKNKLMNISNLKIEKEKLKLETIYEKS